MAGSKDKSLEALLLGALGGKGTDVMLATGLMGVDQKLGKIAEGVGSIAETTRADREMTATRRDLALALTHGDNRSFFKAAEEASALQAAAATEAKLAAEIEGMHLIGSETLDGQPYIEGRIKLPEGVNVLRPIEVKRVLDKQVIGQEQATKSFAIGVSDLYARLLALSQRSTAEKSEGVRLEKNNYLLVGPSGVGKTHLAFNSAALLGVPYVKVPATNLVSGTKGDGVDLAKVLREFCKIDVYSDKSGKQQKRLRVKELAPYGVLFIDEIDKLRDRLDLQHDLLPVLERGEYRLGEGVSFSTGDLWVVSAGRFDGLEKIVSKRLGRELGAEEALMYLNESDLVTFGFIPELARRFQTMVPFKPLSEEALLRILTEGSNSLINQYKYRFALRKLNLVIEEGALKVIAAYAKLNSEGANGLRVAMNKATEDLLFDPDAFRQGGNIILTEEYTRKILII